MKTKLQLGISEPCHEDWNRMTPDEKGRFCNACRKQVVDFSAMTDAQLIAIFQKPAGDSVCGRFMAAQLDRPLEPGRRRPHWFRYFFSLILPVFLFSRASGQKLMGKPAVPERDTTRIPIDRELRTLGMILPTHITPVQPDTSLVTKVEPVKVTRVRVTGRLVNEQNQGIATASIKITQNGKIITTDGQGRFGFIAASDQLLEFICSAEGYASATYIYPFTLQYSGEVDLAIQLKKTGTGAETLQSYCEQELEPYTDNGVTVQRVVTDGTDSLQKDPSLATPEVKFYPNPARSGEPLNIAVTALEKGYYRWQFVDMNGKLVQQRDFWIDQKAAVLKLSLPIVSAGTYVAVLVNRETGKRFSGKIIIQ